MEEIVKLLDLLKRSTLINGINIDCLYRLLHRAAENNQQKEIMYLFEQCSFQDLRYWQVIIAEKLKTLFVLVQDEKFAQKIQKLCIIIKSVFALFSTVMSLLDKHWHDLMHITLKDLRGIYRIIALLSAKGLLQYTNFQILFDGRDHAGHEIQYQLFDCLDQLNVLTKETLRLLEGTRKKVSWTVALYIVANS